jgi:hypothetical protein
MSVNLYGIAAIGLSIAAGLIAYVIAVCVALIVRRHKGLQWTAVLRSKDVLLAIPLGFALGLYLILDLALSVSIYVQITVLYILLWALVLPLFLADAPTHRKFLIVGSLAIALVSMRAIHWNSRKPFLKDLYRIRDGMSAAQVQQIMDGYMTGGGIPLDSPGPRLDGRLAEQNAPAVGTISYRHTNEGWGDSDWGIVTFEDGRVVEVRFLPD